MNYSAIFSKLMYRKLPNEILRIYILELWFSISVICAKWNGYNSYFFRPLAGVRHEGVLSPFLFAVFIDSVVVVKQIKSTGVGFHYFSVCVSVFLYVLDSYFNLTNNSNLIDRLNTI